MTGSIQKSAALAEQVSKIIADDIVGGKYPLGGRLPTEEKLAADFGVSRSVVREAIARMKSDGLVTTRQGLGAFVATTLAGVPFRIAGGEADNWKDVLEVFELRIGVESEAAALAAERATAAQLDEIEAALRSVSESAYGVNTGVDEDMRFHRAIALAANNRLYEKFITFLEFHIRDQLNKSRGRSKQQDRLNSVNEEHQAIFDAIRARDPDAARRAVVTHLRNGIQRLPLGGTED